MSETKLGCSIDQFNTTRDSCDYLENYTDINYFLLSSCYLRIKLRSVAFLHYQALRSDGRASWGSMQAL